ncbi:MAG: alpha-ketoglutarate-dependent dioxygenase AlkB [Bacteroidetes bacterium]|nr:alpha-ketoglutarate-dependent dioxygenase AlkB [Bacteroidota bacterium]
MQTNLFQSNFGSSHNLLPYQGTVNYYGKIFSTSEANEYYQKLLKHIEWKNDEAIIFGKHILTKRKVAWYGDIAFPYTYSNATKFALRGNAELAQLKTAVEKITQSTYNSCLLNLYHNGNEGMAYHSDDEKALLKNGSIASLSFGAERKFCFKHKADKSVVNTFLQHGSLLVMKDETQTNWMHRLPPAKLISQPRINLTFRTIVSPH